MVKTRCGNAGKTIRLIRCKSTKKRRDLSMTAQSDRAKCLRDLKRLRVCTQFSKALAWLRRGSATIAHETISQAQSLKVDLAVRIQRGVASNGHCVLKTLAGTGRDFAPHEP
jgi:hypothetical protein